MSTVKTSLPDSLKEFVDERVAGGGYGSYSEHARELIRRDGREASASRLRALLHEGFAAPMGRDVDAMVADMRARTRRRSRR